jgi:hypothetical protein
MLSSLMAGETAEVGKMRQPKGESVESQLLIAVSLVPSPANILKLEPSIAEQSHREASGAASKSHRL